MKLHQPLILSGILLLALACVIAACSGETATPVVIVVTATAEDTPIPTESATTVLEIVGASETKTLTLAELQALPITEGYAGIKSSTGKITPPIPFKGVALKDLAQFIGGMDETADSMWSLKMVTALPSL
jgi:DMSO/TMAO reductase YedYZ molybdopterin-dependent catalytic subunit